MKNTQKYVGSFALAKLQAKRRSLLAIIAVIVMIGLSMAACAEEESGGELTITDFPASAEGKFAFAMTDGDDELTIIAADSINVKNESVKAGKIKDGKVTLSVYKAEGEKAVDYEGNDKVNFMVMIFDAQNISMSEESEAEPVGMGIVPNVQFKDGVGSGKFVGMSL